MVWNHDVHEHAIVWAQQLVDGHGLELWSRSRFVIRLSPTGEPVTVAQEATDGRMTPNKGR